MSDILFACTDHKSSINKYVDWLFKDKQPFVVLKQFHNEITGVTKMFIALPVRERVFEDSKAELFNPKDLNTSDFKFKDTDIIEYKTLYSGDIFKFYDIPLLLSKFNFTKTSISTNGSKYSSIEKFSLFRNYTRTKKEQEEDFTLIQSFINPRDSVDSIYRLIQTKYVTVISVTFNNPKRFTNGNNSL